MEPVPTSRASSWSFIVANTALAFLALNVLVAPFAPRRAPTPSPGELLPAGAYGPVPAADIPLAGFTLEDVRRDVARFRRAGTVVRPYLMARAPAFSSPTFNVDRDPAGFEARRTLGTAGIDRPEGELFLFGGAPAFGPSVPDGWTVASFLQQALARRGRRVRVWNYSSPEQGPFESQLLFQRLSHSGRVPRLAVFLDGGELPPGNERFHDSMKRLALAWEARNHGLEPVRLPAFFPVFRFIDGVAEARRARALAERELGRVAGTAVDSTPEAAAVSDWSLYEATLRQRRALAARQGTRAAFFWMPHPTAPCRSDGPRPPAAPRVAELYRRAWAHAASDYTALDACTALSGAFLRGAEPAPALAKHLGEAIAERLSPSQREAPAGEARDQG